MKLGNVFEASAAAVEHAISQGSNQSRGRGAGTPTPERRVACDPADLSVKLDGKVDARNVSEDTLVIVGVLADAYPRWVAFSEIEDRLAGENKSLRDSNKTRVMNRVKKEIKSGLRQGIDIASSKKGYRLDLPPGK